MAELAAAELLNKTANGYRGIQIHLNQCCGVKEISLLSQLATPSVDPKWIVEDIYKKLVDPNTREYRCAFILFTQAVPNHTLSDITHRPQSHYGEIFATYIAENHLGSLVKTEQKVNPNSRNLVTVYLWGLDEAAITKHLGKENI